MEYRDMKINELKHKSISFLMKIASDYADCPLESCKKVSQRALKILNNLPDSRTVRIDERGEYLKRYFVQGDDGYNLRTETYKEYINEK